MRAALGAFLRVRLDDFHDFLHHLRSAIGRGQLGRGCVWNVSLGDLHFQPVLAGIAGNVYRPI